MQEEISINSKPLTDEELSLLQKQNTRLVSEFKANKLEADAKKHWDLFYKRNETRFFKDRHWTTREFQELLDEDPGYRRTLLEVGCGVGNFIYPLISDGRPFYTYACDLSSEAVELFQKNEMYDEQNMRAFQSDITTNDIFTEIKENTVNIVTMIFVLSAIHPDKFEAALRNLFRLLKPGGILLFRDYGLYDMAQLRFKAGHKIAENFYMRQDGTRAYYFSTQYIGDLMKRVGFDEILNIYVHRKTINKKENIDVPRIFAQGKFCKPLDR